MRKIKLDLRHLTQAHIDRAMPHREQCAYSAPCLLGAIMTDEDREWLKGIMVEQTPANLCSIGVLAARKMVEFAEPGQASLAQSIQNAFDLGEDVKLVRLLREVDPGLRLFADA